MSEHEEKINSKNQPVIDDASQRLAEIFMSLIEARVSVATEIPALADKSI